MGSTRHDLRHGGSIWFHTSNEHFFIERNNQNTRVDLDEIMPLFESIIREKIIRFAEDAPLPKLLAAYPVIGHEE